MKSLKAIILCAFMGLGTLAMTAQDCRLEIGVGPILDGDNVSESLSRLFEAKMRNALTSHDIVCAGSSSQFFVTARFDHTFDNETGGISSKTAIKTELNIAIADSQSEKIYASTTIPLQGVGSSEKQALVRALSSLSPQNPKLEQFAAEAHQKIMNYFDSNYPAIISRARTYITARNYDEAIFELSLIPSCCRGYEQAQSMMLGLVGDRIDYNGQQLLAKAQGAWAANPTDAGAAEAYKYLSQIDPSASCYSQATALGKKMTESVKADYDFETKTKYRDAVNTERQRIQAAKEVAVAVAKSRPQTIYRVNYIWRRY